MTENGKFRRGSSRRGKPPQRTQAPPVRATPPVRPTATVRHAAPLSMEARIRAIDNRIEWLEAAADHSRKVFERAKHVHDELAAKLRPLTKPAPALAQELTVLARRLKEAEAKKAEDETQLGTAKQERERLMARAQGPQGVLT
jgi:chromosome segregation ATPase